MFLILFLRFGGGEAEVEGDGIFDAKEFAAVLAGNPLRHSTNDTYSLFVQRRIAGRTDNLNMSDRAVLFDNELDDSLALNTILPCNSRIDDIGADEIKQSLTATGELRHLVYNKVNGVFLFVRINHILRQRHRRN